MDAVRVSRRGTRAFDAAKRHVLKLVAARPELLRTVPREYVERVLEEEEDRVDLVAVLGNGADGFALLCDKQIGSWVPPGWGWRYLPASEARKKGGEGSDPAPPIPLTSTLRNRCVAFIRGGPLGVAFNRETPYSMGLKLIPPPP